MDARQAALQVLMQVDPARQPVQPILDRMLDLTEQRQRCTDLVLGVLRNRRAIDRVITRVGAARPERIERPLLNLTRIAIYELVYCPQTPVYALVDQAVGLARAGRSAKRAGFVNALLRRITSHLVDRQVPIGGPADQRRVLPTGPRTGCLFDVDLMPEPGSADYMAVAFSLPRWLAADWLARFGYQQAFQCGLGSTRRPSVYIQPNLARVDRQSLLARLSAAGVQAEPHPAGMIRLASPGRIDRLPGYDEGLFYVQDPAAAIVVQAFHPGPQQTILDLCAAPGGKTIQILQDARGPFRVVATDKDPDRLEILRQNLGRLGLHGVEVVGSEDLAGYVDMHGPFDTVLVDAPCSNTGVLARRVEVRYRLRQVDLPRLCAGQMELLGQARGLVRPGGRIVYSTCSIQQQENQDLVTAFARRGHLVIESERLTLPSAEDPDHDGGYVAVMRA